MDLTSVLDGIFTTNGISFEVGGIMLLGFLAVLMGIQDWRISLISFFAGSALLYIIYYFMDFSMDFITIILLISIILMSFAIYSVRQGGQLVG